jgi:predicted component of type VI protein secretion system
MTLQVHVAGPGVDVTRRLAPGDPALIIGRDADCAICLPDPQRSVSRRHLSVWNEGDQLHFQVLSVVNGVRTAAGEVPPGTRGVLPLGEVMALSSFRLMAEPAQAADDPPSEFVDTWARLQVEAQHLQSGDGATTPYARVEVDLAVDEGVEEDPFGDWGFQSTFGPGSPAGSLRADALQPATDLAPFFSGLGMESAMRAGITNGELETMGRLTRIALLGLLQAVHGAASARQEVRSEDRTVAEGRELNPLRMDTSMETKLHYLFGGQAAGAGFMPADRAVAQVVTELTMHEQAMGEAVRELAQKILEEFAPEALKKRLLGGGPRIFESARAWDAFARDYAEHVSADPASAQKLLDRHFSRAYARALMRAKRNTPGRS